MIIHNIVLVCYLIISIQFFIAFDKTRKQAKYNLLYLNAIFMLCAITRYFMDAGFSNWFTVTCNIVLVLICSAFILTNQSRAIVEALKNVRHVKMSGKQKPRKTTEKKVVSKKKK